jgi:hypothetical protein
VQTSNIEWLNQNANRAYPFVETSYRVDMSGGVRIPNRLIVDFIATMPADSAEQLYMSRLASAGNFLVLFFSARSGASFGSVFLNVSDHVENTAYRLSIEAPFSGSSGRVVVGSLTELLDDFVQGEYLFEPEATLLEAGTTRVDIRGVTSIATVRADGQAMKAMDGYVRLIAGNGVRLRYVPATEVLPHGIRIDAIGGDFNEECECDEQNELPPPIRTINGVAGNAFGAFTIESAAPCVQIAAATNGIVLRDVCSEPCCGCPEQEALTERLGVIQASQVSIDRKIDAVAVAQQRLREGQIMTL